MHKQPLSRFERTLLLLFSRTKDELYCPGIICFRFPERAEIRGALRAGR